MTTQTPAAISEITRVAWWSLRALGCPLGAVERMAKVMAFSEVLEGGCLEALRVREAALIASFAAPEPRFEMRQGTCGVVDAAGRTFLDVGPRSVDVLTGTVRNGHRGWIRVAHAGDFLGLSGACVLAVRRGVAVLAIKHPPQGSGRVEWAFYFPASSGIQRLSGESDSGADGIRQALEAYVVEGQFPLIPSIPAVSALAERADAGHVVDLVGFVSEDVPVLSNDKRGIANWIDVSAALHDAYAHGVVVPADDLKFLYQLETRTWAPSSERSRAQAGFAASNPITTN